MNSRKPSGYVKKGAQPLANFIMASCAPVFEKRGFVRSKVLLEWSEIVGETLARVSAPLKMDWPKIRPDQFDDQASKGATLMVQVASAFALDVQYQIPVLIERINAHFGWRCVSKIVLKQGVIPSKSHQRPQPNLFPEAILEAQKYTQGFDSEPLQNALAKLGSFVLSEHHQKR